MAAATSEAGVAGANEAAEAAWAAEAAAVAETARLRAELSAARAQAQARGSSAAPDASRAFAALEQARSAEAAAVGEAVRLRAALEAAEQRAASAERALDDARADVSRAIGQRDAAVAARADDEVRAQVRSSKRPDEQTYSPILSTVDTCQLQFDSFLTQTCAPQAAIQRLSSEIGELQSAVGRAPAAHRTSPVSDATSQTALGLSADSDEVACFPALSPTSGAAAKERDAPKTCRRVTMQTPAPMASPSVDYVAAPAGLYAAVPTRRAPPPRLPPPPPPPPDWIRSPAPTPQPMPAPTPQPAHVPARHSAPSAVATAFNQPISEWDVSNAEDETERMLLAASVADGWPVPYRSPHCQGRVSTGGLRGGGTPARRWASGGGSRSIAE